MEQCLTGCLQKIAYLIFSPAVHTVVHKKGFYQKHHFWASVDPGLAAKTAQDQQTLALCGSCLISQSSIRSHYPGWVVRLYQCAEF